MLFFSAVSVVFPSKHTNVSVKYFAMLLHICLILIPCFFEFILCTGSKLMIEQ